MSDNKEKKVNPLLKTEKKYAWEKYSSDDLQKVFALGDRYIDFMSQCKTERECVDEFIIRAEKAGYKNIETIISKGETLKVGDKVYANCKGKALALFLIGKEPLEKGMNILGAHIDSPRLDLKQNPLYEDTGFAMLKTHYYGGIKKYQWVTLPLALHGIVAKKNGEVVKVVVGEDENDPVIGISDLLPHLAKDQMGKSLSQAFTGEDLNVTIGSIPVEDKEEKDRFKVKVLSILNEKYGFVEDDLISAEIEVVPAGRARHFGLDKSMVCAYGHDDRVCAYTSFEALVDVKEVDKTAVCLLVDKEEIGSVGASGMHSKFFENTVAEIFELLGETSSIKVRRALRNSKMLSSDVSAAYDPNYGGVSEKMNVAYIGKGVVFNKYTGSGGKGGSNDASAEYMAQIRKIMDDNNVNWQTAELGKVDQGGGGTIAYILANYDMEVIDCGVAVLNMHAPHEIISKADLYETKEAYRVFVLNA